jgi:hypothetical protein
MANIDKIYGNPNNLTTNEKISENKEIIQKRMYYKKTQKLVVKECKGLDLTLKIK